MEISRSYCFSASRSMYVESEEIMDRLETIANDYIDKYGNKEKYVYFVYTHEYYPGNCAFEIDAHIRWGKMANKSNDPKVYISWRELDEHVESVMNHVIQTYSECQGSI